MIQKSPTNINVLTNESCPNSRAFNRPLGAIKDILRNKGYRIKFHLSANKATCDADIVCVNSNVFRPYWSKRKDEIFRFLEDVKNSGKKLFWFDTTDSTWITQFEVIPYVDKFLKGQLLRDRELYLTPFKTGRIYTDTFDTLYNSGEKEVGFPPAKLEYLDKIGLSWNTAFENYTADRHSLHAKIKRKIYQHLLNAASTAIHIPFSAPKSKRSTPVSCRVGLSHSRPSVVAHRRAILQNLETFGISTGRVPLDRYFRELLDTKVAVSPFGVGEITIRDFEIIACGAAMMKPDMSHMETWPDLFQADHTYISHQWDLSDFEEKLSWALDNDDKRLAIAANAQEAYKRAISLDGMKEFADRLAKTLESSMQT